MTNAQVTGATGSDADTPLTDYFQAHRADVLHFLNGKLASPDEAEDLLQQTFLRLLEKNTTSTIHTPRAYLITIARNLLANHYRQRAIWCRRDSIDVEDAELAVEWHSPFEESAYEQYLDQLAGAIEDLSLPVQRAFVLSRVYGYTYREVAALLGLSPRTVEKHVLKGLSYCLTRMRAAGRL